MPEWLIGAVSKTVVGLVPTVGSNPTLSAVLSLNDRCDVSIQSNTFLGDFEKNLTQLTPGGMESRNHFNKESFLHMVLFL